MSIQFEDLPNEIILDLFVYFDLFNLYQSFWGINQRLNTLLRSLTNHCLIIDKEEPFFTEIFARQIFHLKVETSTSIDLTKFSNLQTLELCQANGYQLEQIRSVLMPNLINLNIHTPFHISLPLETLREIFSTDFRFLRHATLNRLDTFQISPRFQSLSLQTLRITCTHANVIIQLLSACPNLSDFHITFFGQNHHILPPSSSSSDHPLEKFFLDDLYHRLSYETIQILLRYIPNVKYLFLRFLCRVPFLLLMENIFQQLEQLNRFECDILELPNTQMIDVESIQQIHECLHNLECIVQNDGSRVFLLE
ncbi:hypothetical protein I4U23_001522 [Adineta vaga]|nr:hypothetical protein I4U23_001522 [Adineta vaga]